MTGELNVDMEQNESHDVLLKNCKRKSTDSINSEKKRETWSNRFDFYCSMLGYSVGLGTIWRFPYVVLRNGAAQYISGGPYTAIIISAATSINGNVILAWSLHYLYSSWRSVLPWTSCAHTYNTDNCVELMQMANGTFNITPEMEREIIFPNKSRTVADEYFHFGFLNAAHNINQFSLPAIHLVVASFCATLLIYLCLFKGIRASGKVAWVTAIAPYFALIALLIRVLFLEGSKKGIIFYLKPKWSELLRLSMWAEACLQLFFMMGPGWGGILTLASYNKFDHNFLLPAIIIPICVAFTGLVCGLIVFAGIGHLAHRLNKQVDQVVQAGPGMCFVVFTEVISSLPVPQLWNTIFFLLIIFIAIDSQFGLFETVSSSLIDEVPFCRKRKELTIFVLLTGFFLISLPYATRSGIFYFTLVDWYQGFLVLPCICILECLFVVYVFGFDNYSKLMERMLGRSLSRLLKYTWGFITPAAMFAVVIYNFMGETNVRYGKYVFPKNLIIAGWSIAIYPIIPAVGHAVWVAWIAYKKQDWSWMFQPCSRWNERMKECS
ncbi:hypothetical protein SNEBB_001752 [Seison nebaliae]|nr:hypothetical protein SNEBB_001752 [Seison nebaliae]